MLCIDAGLEDFSFMLKKDLDDKQFYAFLRLIQFTILNIKLSYSIDYERINITSINLNFIRLINVQVTLLMFCWGVNYPF